MGVSGVAPSESQDDLNGMPRTVDGGVSHKSEAALSALVWMQTCPMITVP